MSGLGEVYSLIHNPYCQHALDCLYYICAGTPTSSYVPIRVALLSSTYSVVKYSNIF